MHSVGGMGDSRTAISIDIGDLRRRLGGQDGPISQGALAALLGASQSTVSRMEAEPARQRGPVAILLRKLDAETRQGEAA